eukprot:10964084-Alexandrium_andersonii.AAC.1
MLNWLASHNQPQLNKLLGAKRVRQFWGNAVAKTPCPIPSCLLGAGRFAVCVGGFWLAWLRGAHLRSCPWLLGGCFPVGLPVGASAIDFVA